MYFQNSNIFLISSGEENITLWGKKSRAKIIQKDQQMNNALQTFKYLPCQSRLTLDNRNKGVRLLLVGVAAWGRVACSSAGPVFLEGARWLYSPCSAVWQERWGCQEVLHRCLSAGLPPWPPCHAHMTLTPCSGAGLWAPPYSPLCSALPHPKWSHLSLAD